MMAQEQLRHDPILHRVDHFVRGENGEVEKCDAPKMQTDAQYHKDMIKACKTPRHAGRKKGVNEFNDLSGLCAPNWDPAYRIAMDKDPKVFHRAVGECSERIDVAAGYPNRPKVFVCSAINSHGVPAEPLRAATLASAIPAESADVPVAMAPTARRAHTRPSSARPRRPMSASRVAAARTGTRPTAAHIVAAPRVSEPQQVAA